uniref:Palmitoyltransferase n=1 Tax=Trichuris muris TaxID=70415 RepID=A0A5S6QJC0_TRIMR
MLASQLWGVMDRMGIKSCLNSRLVFAVLQLFRWVPVLFILAVVTWSYYAYVVALCLLNVDDGVEQAFLLICYHALLIVFLWSYWQTIFSKPLIPPLQFRLSSEAMLQLRHDAISRTHSDFAEKLVRSLPLRCRSLDGGLRVCDKCYFIKPDRCHHCSVCGTCLLKMDHHCPWVNNCVHFGNYKFFIQFLGYAWLLCLFIALTDLKHFIAFWMVENRMQKNTQFHIMFLFFVACMFFISVSSLLFYHLWLTSKNRTTLEAFRAPVFTHGPNKNGFNYGTVRNFQEVFGKRPILWFLPVYTSLGDGVTFEPTEEHVGVYRPQ